MVLRNIKTIISQYEQHLGGKIGERYDKHITFSFSFVVLLNERKVRKI